MSDYDDAVAALEHAEKDPKAFSADEVEAFLSIVQKGGPTPNAAALANEPALAKVITPLTRNPEPPDPGLSSTTSPKEFEGLKQKHDDWYAGMFDNSYASASKMKELYAPPEIHAPPSAPDHAGLSALLHPLDLLARAKDALPSAVGGKVDHYFEPSLEQFQHDMGPIYGPEKVANATEQSREFQMYADAQWKKIYEQAKSEGKSAVRHAYAQHEGWAKQIEHGLVGAAGTLGAAADSAVDAATLGLAPRAIDLVAPGYRANAQKLQSAEPVASFVGSLLGAASPLSVPNRAASLVGGTGIGRSALRGAIGGAGDVLGRGAVDALSGDQVDPTELGKQAGVAALSGGAMGGALDSVGALANLHGTSLRKAHPEIEASGGKTRAWAGFEPAPDVLAARAAAAGHETTDAALLASRLEGPLTAQADLQGRTAKDFNEGVTQQYYAQHRDTEVPVTPLLSKAMELHANLHGPDGTQLPGAHEGTARILKNEIGKMAHVRVGELGADNVIPFSQARAAGLDVDRALSGLTAQQIHDLGGLGIEVTPRSYNPEHVDKIIEGLDRQLKAEKVKGPHPELDSLLEASRATRDQFPDSDVLPRVPEYTVEGHAQPLEGWSAWKHHISDEMQLERRSKDFAGMSGDPGSANQSRQLFNAAVGYGKPGVDVHPEVGQRLRDLADRSGPDTRADLDTIQRIHNTRDVEAQNKIAGRITSTGPRANLTGMGVRLRLDPLLSHLALPQGPGIGGGLRGGAVGGAAGEMERRNRYQGEQPTLDEINRLLNPGMPY